MSIKESLVCICLLIGAAIGYEHCNRMYRESITSSVSRAFVLRDKLSGAMPVSEALDEKNISKYRKLTVEYDSLMAEPSTKIGMNSAMNYSQGAIGSALLGIGGLGILATSSIMGYSPNKNN